MKKPIRSFVMVAIVFLLLALMPVIVQMFCKNNFSPKDYISPFYSVLGTLPSGIITCFVFATQMHKAHEDNLNKARAFFQINYISNYSGSVVKTKIR